MPATTEEDSSFSELMLRWLDEGDRLHENPAPTGPIVDLRRKRSWRLLIAGGSLVILTVVVRFVIYDVNRPLESTSQAAPAPAQITASMVAPVAREPVPVPVPAPVPVAAVAAPVALVAAVAAAPEPAPTERVAVAVTPTGLLMAAPAVVTEAPALPPSEATVAAAPKAEAVVAVAAEPAPAPAAPLPLAVAPAVADDVKVIPSAPVAPVSEQQAALAAAPVDFESLAARCREATSRGRWSAARSACGAAREARPDSPDVLTRLAEIALNRGQGRQALRLANSALASDPAFADAYVIVGSVEQEANRVEQARAAYERYLQLAPSGRFASDLRAILATP